MTTTTMPKRAPAVSFTMIAPLSMEVTFASGRTITIDASALSPSICHAAMMHGLKQKLGDGAAIGRDPVTGRTATAAEKEQAVREIYNRISDPDGSWNVVKDGTSTGGGSNLLIRALMQLTGKMRSSIEIYLEGKSKEERAALKKNPRVAAIIVELQAASVDASIDTDGMLDELADE